MTSHRPGSCWDRWRVEVRPLVQPRVRLTFQSSCQGRDREERIPTSGYLWLQKRIYISIWYKKEVEWGEWRRDDWPLQSFMTTIPKMCSCAFWMGIGCPKSFPGPTKNAISSSKSSRRQGPKTGGCSKRRRDVISCWGYDQDLKKIKKSLFSLIKGAKQIKKSRNAINTGGTKRFSIWLIMHMHTDYQFHNYKIYKLSVISTVLLVNYWQAKAIIKSCLTKFSYFHRGEADRTGDGLPSQKQQQTKRDHGNQLAGASWK